MQFLELTIYASGQWSENRLRKFAGAACRAELLASDMAACLLALDPVADPAPRVIQVESPIGYPHYYYDETNRPHFEDFMDSYRVLVLLPMNCDLVGLEERLRPSLTERFLHISVRRTVADVLARNGVVLKAGDAWLHSTDQAQSLTGVPLPVRPWFGPIEAGPAESSAVIDRG